MERPKIVSLQEHRRNKKTKKEPPTLENVISTLNILMDIAEEQQERLENLEKHFLQLVRAIKASYKEEPTV